jgi:hypothetical protein
MLKLLATAALASAFVLSSAAITSASAEGHMMRSHGGAGHHRLHAPRPARRAVRPILRRHRPAAKAFRPMIRHRHPIHARPRPSHWRRGSRASHWRHGSRWHQRTGSRWHRRFASHARYGSKLHWRHGSHWRLYSHKRYGSAWGYPVPVPIGAGVATYAAPVSGCTCLTKDYLEDGSVRFTDTCTKEFAINPPPVPDEAPGPAPQN